MERPEPQPQPIELYPRRPYGLDAMDPAVAIALLSELYEAAEWELDQKRGRELSQRIETFHRELDGLPHRSPESAEAILTAFADAEDWLHRNTVACVIPELTKVRPEAGLRIWAQLLRDDNEGVRESALISLIQDAWGDEQLRELTLKELGPLIVGLVDGLKGDQEWYGRVIRDLDPTPSRDPTVP